MNLLVFLPNSPQYIECIFACILANINLLHCSYDNILKNIFLPEIDLIVTSRENWDIIDKMLSKSSKYLIDPIKKKLIIV